MADVSKYEVLSRCLQAASGAVPLDKPQSLYLIQEEDGQLVERLVQGNEAVDQDLIAENVKSQSPAAYVYKTQADRSAFFVSEDNTLKFYRYKDEWTEAGFGSLGSQKVHANGKVAATVSPNGIVVYYQDPSGNFKGIEEHNGTWKSVDSISVKAQEGTPLSLSYLDLDKNLYLYYVGTDHSLHFQVISYGNWNSNHHVYTESKFDKPIQSFMVCRGSEDGNYEAYFKTPSTKRPNASVFTRVDSDGTRAVLGYLEKGKFEPDSSAQCFRMCYNPCIVWYIHHMRHRPCFCW